MQETRIEQLADREAEPTGSLKMIHVGAAGLSIDWDDLDELSRATPLLARIYPNGGADVNHFQAAGGLGFAISAGPAAGRRITLAEGQSAGIGRSPDADIAVEADTFMSRRHAHISVQGGAAVVQDDGSANGTFVNGSRVTQQALRPGDIISVGQTQIRVE